MKQLAIMVSLIFWPLSLLLANLPGDFANYALPLLFILISFLLYRKGWKYFAVPLLPIPLFEPKIALFPIIFLLCDIAFTKKDKSMWMLLLISIIIFFISWKGFWGQTIFIPDYEARQEVIRETQTYPSIFLARLFHNKVRIVLDKFTYNLFALTDPNNYFFGFHPRQIVENQNLIKFPFLGILFLSYGLYFISKSIAGVLSLSFLTIFDRNDFLLWLPLSLLFVHGIKLFSKLKFSYLIFDLFIVFTFSELLRLFIQFY